MVADCFRYLLIFVDIFHIKIYKKNAGSSFFNVSICCFSLSFQLVNEKYWGFVLFFVEECNFTLITLRAGQLWWAVSTILSARIDWTVRKWLADGSIMKLIVSCSPVPERFLKRGWALCLAGEERAIRECRCHEGVYLCVYVWVNVILSANSESLMCWHEITYYQYR